MGLTLDEHYCRRGLYMNVYDMAKWDAALYTEKILKRSSLEQMWTPVKLNNGQTYPYGFGWSLGGIPGHRYVQHAGAWQEFKAQIQGPGGVL